MVKRIIAIGLIFLGASLAWLILGATIMSRTYSSDEVAEKRVASLWGAAQTQAPPTASFRQNRANVSVARPGGATPATTGPADAAAEYDQVDLPLEASRVDVALNLGYRQKGLLWYSTYKVDFAGVYTFRNTSDKEQTVAFKLKFPTAQAIYDNLVFAVDNVPLALTNENSAATGTVVMPAGKTATLKVGYASQGLTEWRYHFGDNVTQVRNFVLNMKTNFTDIDFPENSLSPSAKTRTANGWDLVWDYKNLLSGYQIAMAMPEKLQPGPLAGRISFFAPVSLFFFFFLMFIITTLRGIELHPMNYFFLAAAFFAFHLLMAYLVDHISIHWSFAISALVSVALVISYLRLVVGINFAVREAAIAQCIYLIAFSYAFFLKGFTGLAITIGSILTLFVVMQATGRIRWSEKFAGTEAKPSGDAPPEKVSVVP